MARKLRPEILADVESMLGLFLKPHQVVTRVRSKFAISERQAKRYLQAVREQVKANADVDRSERRAWIRGQFETLYRKALSAGHIRTAKEILCEMVSLDGLDAPTRIEMQHLAIDMDAGKLTSHDAILERLAELRKTQGDNSIN